MDKKQIIKLQVLIDQYKEIRSEYFEEGNMPYNNYTQIYKDTLQLMDEIIMKADQLTEQGGGVDPYSGELNTERIRQYRKLAKEYNISEVSIARIFCKGLDWGLSLKQPTSQ